MRQRKEIKCTGIKPDADKCLAVLCETDGRAFYIQGLALELDPPRIRCDRCGKVTHLRYDTRRERQTR